MKKISYNLWFDKQAAEAANFYQGLFPNSKIKSSTKFDNTPSGEVEIINMDIAGESFMLMSAGPLFKFNPSISFFVCCQTVEEVDELWKGLSTGGKVLMELQEYPFSRRYGWVQDKFGLSWQLMFMNNQPFEQKIIPLLAFTGELAGKTEEAINFYSRVFHNSKINYISRYGKGMEPDKENSINHVGFILEGQQFAAMDSAREHNFKFNEAISFVVNCKDQEEIDYYWEKLSADPKAEQCGWLKDRYGVSWQIVPDKMQEMMSSGDQQKIARVVQAFMKMKKFNIAALEAAYEGK